ncbi:MAG: radical SAM protein [Armatimonadetes bacterium]|nr:radical SAM protein [Armatimonadota bacterium]
MNNNTIIEKTPVVLLELTEDSFRNTTFWNCIPPKSGRDEAGEMSSTTLAQVLRHLTEDEKKPSRVLLCGGEPLLHPKFLDVIQYLGEKGIPTTLVSDGLLLSPATVHTAMGLGLSDVRLPLFGFSSDVHDLIIMEDAWNFVLADMKALGNEGIPYTVDHFILKDKEGKGRVEGIKLAVAFGAEKILLRAFDANSDPRFESLVPQEEELISVLKWAGDLASEADVSIFWSPADPDSAHLAPESLLCACPISGIIIPNRYEKERTLCSLSVNPEGAVTMVHEGGEPVGNLVEESFGRILSRCGFGRELCV